MEVGLHITKKTLEDWEREIICAVCMKHYTDSKILPCLHSKEFIRALSRKAGKDETFYCPECRKDTILSEGGVDDFKLTFFIHCFKSMYTRHNEAFIRQTNGGIPHPSNYVEVNNMPKEAKVNKEVTIELVISISTVTRSKLNLQCQIKCIPIEAAINAKIVEKNPDKYEISFTPRVCGRHELSICACGKPVPGSPFSIYMFPENFDKAVNVWTGVSKPRSMVVNSIGEIIVAKCDGDIVVLDKEGKILRRIAQSQHKMKRLHCVAVDNEDSIYFTGRGISKIGKANRSGDILLVRDTDEGLRYMAVVGDEVMVTEYSNDGYIKIYNKNLNYVRQITSRNKTALCCLCPDQHGNLYISDDENTIQVITKKGDIIRSFSCVVSNRVLNLFFPMHVYNQHVYVRDFNLKKIVVFTTEGEHVTSFRCCGFGDICVDQNGVLYVSDYFEDKINVYHLC